ncbi:MAG: phage portal protein [archaeon]
MGAKKLQAVTKEISVPREKGPPQKYLAVFTKTLAAADYPSIRSSDYRRRGGKAAQSGDNFTEYKRNFLVRGAVDALALWSVKEGFETVLEPGLGMTFKTENEKQAYLDKPEYRDAKSQIDQINSDVELDWNLRRAVTQTKIEGRAPFEIVFKKENAPWEFGNLPQRLDPLPPLQVRPNVDPDTWKLLSFHYKTQKDYFQPEELLYFVNNDLSGNLEGMSDIEPILKEAQLDSKIIREDLTEAAATLWAGIMVWILDLDKCKGLTKEQIEKLIDDHILALRPGKHVVTDNRWTVIPVTIDVHIERLLEVSDKMERRILGNFKVPRLMLNLEAEINRATAYARLEEFVDGPIADLQRWLKRTVEHQWYDRLTRQILQLAPTEKLPIRITHQWREIRTTDWMELLRVVSEAYAEGMGVIDRKKAYELLQKGKSTTFNADDRTTG